MFKRAKDKNKIKIVAIAMSGLKKELLPDVVADWQLTERHCSLRGQYNQPNEQLEAERELLRGGVRYIRESRAARCWRGQGWMPNVIVGRVARLYIT